MERRNAEGDKPISCLMTKKVVLLIKRYIVLSKLFISASSEQHRGIVLQVWDVFVLKARERTCSILTALCEEEDIWAAV